MLSLTVYKLRRELESGPTGDFDDLVDFEGRTVNAYGPVGGAGFEAKLYVASVAPHEPRWAPFLKSGFGDELSIPHQASGGALLLVRIGGSSPDYFALPFGVSGRFLLRDGAAERAYGLRTALNLIYPLGSAGDASSARLIGMDTKRRAADTVRSRSQASRATTFEPLTSINSEMSSVGLRGGRPIEKPGVLESVAVIHSPLAGISTSIDSASYVGT